MNKRKLDKLKEQLIANSKAVNVEDNGLEIVITPSRDTTKEQYQAEIDKARQEYQEDNESQNGLNIKLLYKEYGADPKEEGNIVYSRPVNLE